MAAAARTHFELKVMLSSPLDKSRNGGANFLCMNQEKSLQRSEISFRRAGPCDLVCMHMYLSQ